MYNMFAVTQFTEETGAILLLMLAAAVSGFFTTSSGTGPWDRPPFSSVRPCPRLLA
jgi:hypothetical protein